MENKIDKLYIECECMSHVLQVTNDVVYYELAKDEITKYQDIHLAIYHYGIESHKDNIWKRIGFAFRYIWNGKMFGDQIALNKDEAKKLGDFLTEHTKD